MHASNSAVLSERLGPVSADCRVCSSPVCLGPRACPWSRLGIVKSDRYYRSNLRLFDKKCHRYILRIQQLEPVNNSMKPGGVLLVASCLVRITSILFVSRLPYAWYVPVHPSYQF